MLLMYTDEETKPQAQTTPPRADGLLQLLTASADKTSAGSSGWRPAKGAYSGVDLLTSPLGHFWVQLSLLAWPLTQCITDFESGKQRPAILSPSICCTSPWTGLCAGMLERELGGHLGFLTV